MIVLCSYADGLFSFFGYKNSHSWDRASSIKQFTQSTPIFFETSREPRPSFAPDTTTINPAPEWIAPMPATVLHRHHRISGSMNSCKSAVDDPARHSLQISAPNPGCDRHECLAFSRKVQVIVLTIVHYCQASDQRESCSISLFLVVFACGFPGHMHLTVPRTNHISPLSHPVHWSLAVTGGLSHHHNAKYCTTSTGLD